MTDKVKSCIANLKHKPGVYLMHDKNDRIIYVGKAKDLFKRVSQYFLRPQSGKVFAMVQNVDYFETIITQNEKEAFVLEMNLIQTHYPKYNILLKDGSHYPYIALKRGNDPVISIKRNNKDKGYEYFGPFPSSGSAYEMIDLINKIFPIRKCKAIPSNPCLYYHMGQCLGPCINNIDEETYLKLREDIHSFLKGNNQNKYSEIKSKMLQASENLDFEVAATYKKILDAIDHINTSQTVEVNDKTNRDIFAYFTREGYLSLAILLFRSGKLLGKNTFVVEEFDDNEEQVSELICQYYQAHPLPSEIVINNENIRSNLSELLDCNVISVTKGKIHELVSTCLDNATNGLDQYFMSARLDDNKLALLEELASILGISTPLHIELFDNSHIQGSSPVGAMVAFINGEPNKKLYRKFHIEHTEARDDLLSMKEVITRHYSRNKQENKKMPDLLLVDGGLNQIKFADEALKEIEVDIPLFGLYKNDRHQTEGLMDKDGNTYKIENKNIFFLLTRMQDEVHRFAISFHRDQRNKKMTKSILDDIKGLGSHRKELINKVYTDINVLKNATVEELSQIVPEAVAKQIYDKLHS